MRRQRCRHTVVRTNGLVGETPSSKMQTFSGQIAKYLLDLTSSKVSCALLKFPATGTLVFTIKVIPGNGLVGETTSSKIRLDLTSSKVSCALVKYVTNCKYFLRAPESSDTGTRWRCWSGSSSNNFLLLGLITGTRCHIELTKKLVEQFYHQYFGVFTIKVIPGKYE
jgi:hypothetical protein